jgi:hypothetical protein
MMLLLGYVLIARRWLLPMTLSEAVPFSAAIGLLPNVPS